MSKQCSNCHSSIDDTAAFCPSCGAQQPTESTWENTVFWSDPVSTTGVSGGKDYPSSAAKGLSVALAVFCFISAAGSLLMVGLVFAISQMAQWAEFIDTQVEAIAAMAAAAMNAYFSLFVVLCAVDVVFYTVFGILLLVKKSWKIALTITIYGGFWYLLTLLQGAPLLSIPMLPILGVLCTIWLRKDSMKIV